MLLLSAHNEPEPSVPTTTLPPFLHTLSISDIAFSYSSMNSSAVMDMTRSKLSSGKSRDTASPTETLVNPFDLAISSIFSDTSIPVISRLVFHQFQGENTGPDPYVQDLVSGLWRCKLQDQFFFVMKNVPSHPGVEPVVVMFGEPVKWLHGDLSPILITIHSFPFVGGHGPLLKERWISGPRIMRSDGVVCVDGHPTVAIRISASLVRSTSPFYQVEERDTTTLLSPRKYSQFDAGGVKISLASR